MRKQVHAKVVKKSWETPGVLDLAEQYIHKQHCDHGSTILINDGIETPADEVLDAKVQLDLLEEQFELQTISIELSNLRASKILGVWNKPEPSQIFNVVPTNKTKAFSLTVKGCNAAKFEGMQAPFTWNRSQATIVQRRRNLIVLESSYKGWSTIDSQENSS